MLPYKLITFDATGTLFYFTIPVLEKYMETALKFGIKTEFNVLQNNVKKAWQMLDREHPNFGSTRLGWQKWWTQLVEQTFAGFIKPEDKPKAAAIAEDLIDFYSTKSGFTVRPGTLDLLKYLQTKSIQLGVISNFDPRLHGILESLEIKKYFNFILTSYEFGCCKPDPRIFKVAATLGKCQSPSDALHVGDNLELDYVAAKKAGLNAILIGETKTGVREGEHFEDFHKLKTHFQSLAKASRS